MAFLFPQHPAAYRGHGELEFRSDLRKACTADQTPFPWETWLSSDKAIVVALAASIALLVGTQGPFTQMDYAILSQLRAIQINDALLRRDVSRARTNAALDSRSVASAGQALQRNRESLRRAPEVSPDESSGQSRLRAQLINSIENKEAAVSALIKQYQLVQNCLADLARSFGRLGGHLRAGLHCPS